MGRETQCVVWHGEKCSLGVACLEPKELLFEGTFELHIPLDAIVKASASGGILTVSWARKSARFSLGRDAAKWLLQLRYPKPVLDKLGVKAGMRVSMIGVEDAEFELDLQERVPEFCSGRALKNSDLIFFGITSEKDFKRLAALRKSLQPAGALWTVYPKGRKDLSQSMVMAAGKAAGLVDIKVVSFSETHTSLKWVIPVSARK